MTNKITDELFNEIMKADNIDEYLCENKDEVTKLQIHTYLNELLLELHISKAEVLKRSNLDKTYGYHIFSGEKQPSRDKVIALGFGFSLSLEAFQKLLRYSNNRELYPRDKRDSVILFALSKGFSVIDCNIALDELGLVSL